MTHRPLINLTCDYCDAPFGTVSPKARFCSTRCKNAHWKTVYKRFALVDLFMDCFKLAESARVSIQCAVLKAERKLCELATLLGYQYRPKQYQWVKVAK